MSRRSQAITFAALSVLWCGSAFAADTLRCRSVNGNVNCAGSGGVSCQTINGKTTCVGGHGDAVQSFGNDPSSPPQANDDTDDNDPDATSAPPASKTRIERRTPSGHTMLIERDGTKLHLRSGSLSVDRD